MPHIDIRVDERYPDRDWEIVDKPDEYTYEVDQETLDRWKQLSAGYEQLQKELAALSGDPEDY